MKQAISLLLVALAIAMPTTAFAEGKIYQTSNFNRINASGAANIQYIVSDKCSVMAKGKPEDIERYDVKIDKNNLVIKPKSSKEYNVKQEDVIFYVTGPAKMQEIDLSGTSLFETESTLSGDIAINISGVSTAICKEIVAQKVEIDCSGVSSFGGNIKADKVSLDCSGTSSLDGSVKGSKISLDCSGVSNVTLDVQCDEIKADASGISKITLSGSAKTIKTSASSQSLIDQNDLATK